MLLAYYVNGTAFLAFSSIAERTGHRIDDGRSLSFLGGIAEGAETILVHSLWLLVPGTPRWSRRCGRAWSASAAPTGSSSATAPCAVRPRKLVTRGATGSPGRSTDSRTHDDSTSSRPRGRRRAGRGRVPPAGRLRLAALVLGFAGGSVALHLSGWSGPERLQALVESAGWAGAVVFVVGYAVLVLVPSPASVLTILSGVLFGLWWGTLLAWAGALLGAFGGFLLGRRLGRPAVDRMLRGRLQDADQVLARHGLVAVLAVRLLPLFPFTPINYASGLLGVRLRDYVLGTAVGHRARRPRVRRCRRLGGRPARHRRRRRGLLVLTLLGGTGRRRLARPRPARSVRYVAATVGRCGV